MYFKLYKKEYHEELRLKRIEENEKRKAEGKPTVLWLQIKKQEVK